MMAFFGGSGSKPPPENPDPKLNRSMYVSPSKDKKSASPPAKAFKEDPGPIKGKMVSYKRTNVKTIEENKKRIDDKERLLPKEKRPQDAESRIAIRELMIREDVGHYFELNYEQLVADLKKTEGQSELDVIREVVRYLHEKGVIIKKLEDQEQGLHFSLATKEERELLIHLTKSVGDKTSENNTLQETFATLTREKNEALENLKKAQKELNSRNKKIKQHQPKLNKRNRQKNKKNRKSQGPPQTNSAICKTN